MADGPGSLALYQSETSVRAYCLSLIILRVFRFSPPAPPDSRHGCHGRRSLLPPPQRLYPRRYGGQSGRLHDAREMACL
jgi:hypothetical protein